MLRARSLSMPERRAASMKELEAIMEAILGRDPARAWETCRTHVRNAAVYALKSFDQETLPRLSRRPAERGEWLEPRPVAKSVREKIEKKLARPVEIWRQLPGRNSGARLTKRVLVGPNAVLVFSYGVHHGFVCSLPVAPYPLKSAAWLPQIP
jgi:hypothetical protein